MFNQIFQETRIKRFRRSNDYDNRYTWQNLEDETEKGNYQYWLQQRDIADIARTSYQYDQGYDKQGRQTQSETIFEICDLNTLNNQLAQFKGYVDNDEQRPLTLIINLGAGHWVTLIVQNKLGHYYAYYSDSLGHKIQENVESVLRNKISANVNIFDLKIEQQVDGHNCGIFSLLNANKINELLKDNKPFYEVDSAIRGMESSSDFLVGMRRSFSEELKKDSERLKTNIRDFALGHNIDIREISDSDINQPSQSNLKNSQELGQLFRRAVEKDYIRIASFAVKIGVSNDVIQNLSDDEKENLKKHIEKHDQQFFRDHQEIINLLKVEARSASSKQQSSNTLRQYKNREKPLDPPKSDQQQSGSRIERSDSQYANQGSSQTDSHQSGSTQRPETSSQVSRADTGIEDRIRNRKISISKGLLIASESGDYKKVEQLITEQADINFQDQERKTALHYAVEGGKLEVVKLLLDNKAKINIESKLKKTPLQVALSLLPEIVPNEVNDNLEVAICLLNRISDIKEYQQSFDKKEILIQYVNKFVYQNGVDLDKFLLLSLLLPEEEFKDKYRKLYSNQSKPVDESGKVYIERKDVNYKKVTSLYLNVLSEVKGLIERGDVDRLKNLSILIASITKIEKKTLLETIFNKEDNPIKDTNLIILACKHNQPEILKYLLSIEGSDLLKNLSDYINKPTINPTDTDGENHNAFYYAIRSGNVELLEVLIKWPNNFFYSLRSTKLGDFLSRSYKELKLRNVEISEVIQIFVEDLLIRERFFSITANTANLIVSKNIQGVPSEKVDNAYQQINIILTAIDDFNKTIRNVDEIGINSSKVLFIARFIAQNIRILKRQLKSTYEKIQWEEIEFYLSRFASLDSIQRENLQGYMIEFADKLKSTFGYSNSLKDNDVNNIKNNIKSYINKEEYRNRVKISGLESLYTNYELLKDAYSLNRMLQYIELALSVNTEEISGQLIIQRALQVIGEYIKNTPSSPHLSENTERTLVLMGESIINEIAPSLRDRLSHPEWINILIAKKCIEKEVDIFTNVQNDLRRVQAIFIQLLYNIKIVRIRDWCKKIISNNNPEKAKELADEFSDYINRKGYESKEITMRNTGGLKKIEDLIEKIRQITDLKTDNEDQTIEPLYTQILTMEEENKKLFTEISNIIESKKNKIQEIEINHYKVVEIVDSLIREVRESLIRNDNSDFKKRAQKTLEVIMTGRERGTMDDELKKINDLIDKISKNNKGHNKYKEIVSLASEINYIINLENSKIRGINVFKEKLDPPEVDISSKVEAELDDVIDIFRSEIKNDKKYQELVSKLENQKQTYRTKLELIGHFEDKIKLTQQEYNKLVAKLNESVDKKKKLSGYYELKKSYDKRKNLMKKAHDHYGDFLDGKKDFNKLLKSLKLPNHEKLLKSIFDEKKGLLQGCTNESLLHNVLDDIKVLLTNEEYEELIKELEKKKDAHKAQQKLIDFFENNSALEEGEYGQLVDRLDTTSINKKELKELYSPVSKAIHEVKTLTDNYGAFIKAVTKKEVNIDEILSSFIKFSKTLQLESDSQELLKKIFTEKKIKILEDYFSDRLNSLKERLENVGYGSRHELISHYKQDKKLQAEVEILLLNLGKIFSNIAQFSSKNVEESFLFLDGQFPILTGISLRHYLAHGDALIDSLYCDPIIAVISNAIIFVKEGESIIALNKLVKDSEMKKYLINKVSNNLIDKLSKEGLPTNLQQHKGSITALQQSDHWIDYLTNMLNNRQGNILVVKSDVADSYNQNLKLFAYQDELFDAVKQSDKQAIENFLKTGGDINIRSGKSWTLLHVASYKGYNEIVKILLNNRAQIDAVNKDGHTALHLAAYYGHHLVVETLLKNGAQANSINSKKDTPLHYTALRSHKIATEILLKHGADVNARDNNDRTPVYNAVFSGSLNIIKLFAEEDFNVDVFDKGGLSLLHWAALSLYNVETIKYLLEKGAKIDAKAKNSITPLHLAAGYKGVIANVEVLLSNGAKINIKDNDEWTPLHCAASRGHEQIVEVLLKNNKDIVNDKDKIGCTPLHYAAQGGHNRVIKILLEGDAEVDIQNGYGWTPLHVVASFGALDVVTTLTQEGKANINIPDYDGKTSLHFAAQYGNVGIIELLVDNDVVSMPDKGGNIPLHYAAQNGHADVVIALLNYIDRKLPTKLVELVDNKNDQGVTPLHFAAEGGYKTTAEALLSKGADANIESGYGNTPLHIAVLNGNLDMVKYLVDENDAKVNSKNNLGRTPLICATYTQHSKLVSGLEIVEYLLGKDTGLLNVPDKDDRTPLHWAAEEGNTKVVSILLKKLADNFQSIGVNTPDKYGKTPIYLAAYYGNLGIVKLLIENDADINIVVNVPDKNNRTPLHAAAYNGYKNIAEVLLENNADLSVPDKYGMTPLHFAASNGNLGVTKLFVRKGANVNAETNERVRPLHYAAKGGYDRIVEILLQNGASVNADYEGVTPLHEAAYNGYKNTVEILLQNGANVNAETGKGVTPLHLAAENGHKDVVDLLLRHSKIEVNAKTEEQGATPLHLAAENGHKDVVDLLLRNSKIEVNAKTEEQGATPLHLAARGGHDRIVEILLHNGANVNAETGKGVTPLHLAALGGHNRIVEILLHNRAANVNAADKLGRTSLNLAADRGNVEVVNVLLNNKANVDIGTKKGVTPLHSAALGGHDRIVEILLHNGANINAADSEGSTPLHYAATIGHKNVVEVLLDNEAEVNLHNNHNMTPLHLAASRSYMEIVELLLKKVSLDPLKWAATYGYLNVVKYLIDEKSVNVETKDNYGRTSLHWAAQNGHKEIVDTLLNKGANVNAADSEKTTPLHVASYVGHKEVVEVLLNNGAIYNAKTQSQHTPLQLTKDSNIKSLLELVGNLFQAVEQENKQEVDRIIKEEKVTVNAKDSAGMTPLHWAIHKNYKNIVTILLYSGVNVFQVTSDRDNKQNTSLHIASSKGHKELVELLLKHIQEKHSDRLADFINAGTNEKNTALHIVVKKGNFEIVKLLLDYGADPNAKNSQNQTPLLLAIEKCNEGVVKTLLDNKKIQVNSDYLNLANTKLNSSTEQAGRYAYEKIKQMLEQKLQESWEEYIRERQIIEASECLPNGRRRREIGKCELSWNTDIEKIREGKENIRSLSNLKINSDKFIDYIKSISENKHTQLIQLAGQVPVTGKSEGLVNKLINNQKFINHLGKVGMISGITMQGMMAKNVLADAVNDNYQGLAINLGFIALPFGVKAGENAALKGLHSASEIAYARGFKLAPLVESSLAQAFKVSSSFLARSTSAFIAYDLVKELRNGTVVGVVGDSVYLGGDAAELGIEVAEGFGVLEGVSSVTGPIGATIGAVVFVGTDVYQAVKKVENIDRLVHLTAEERFLEGIRAFIGIGTEKHIEELIEEKQLYNQLVRQALEYLKQHNDIQRYVFPTGKLVQDTCSMVQYKEQCPSLDIHSDLMVMPGEPTGLGIRNACHKDKNGNLFILKEREECITKFKPDSNNMVILDEQKPGIKWSEIRPDNSPEGNLFCITQGHGDLAPGLAYSCNNAIGVEYSSNRTNNYTFIDLGDGTDLGIGFNNNSNIFLIGNGYKTIHGGEKDDTFILQGDSFEGQIFGRNGANTLDLSKFSPQSKSLSLNFRGSHLPLSNLPLSKGLIDQISKVITRENKEDIISCDVSLKYIDGRGGKNEKEQDIITVNSGDYLSGKFIPKVQIMLRDYTVVNNRASKGNFSYFVDQKKGKASVDILSTSKNEFIFNNTLEDIKAINFNSNDVRTVKFVFSPHNTETLISYRVQNISFTLKDGIVISVSKEGNLYALQNSNKSVDEIINSYSRVANNLKMSIFVHSLLNNESIVVGHGKHDVIENNPEYKSHLIGNGGENIFVVTSDKLPIPEIVLYDVDQENKIDTLDLRKIRKQVESDLNVKVKTRIITSDKDLIIQLFYEKDNEVSESNIVQVRLKNGLLTNWYDRLHVIMNHVPMKIEEFELRPLPLVFDNNEEIIRIAVEDVGKNNKIIISQKIEDYTFSKLGNDLIMTFNHNASLILSEFYKNKEMETLTIRFANKEVTIKDELNNVRSFDDLKEEYKNSTANIINSFNTTEAIAGFNSTEASETRVEPLKRNRRAVQGNVKSSASSPTSFVNTIVNAFTNVIIGTVQGIISARTSASGYSTQCHIDDKPSNYKSSFNGYKPESSISQVNVQTDINSTILLLDLLIRRVTGQKYNSTAEQSISPPEAQGYALNITNRFEKVLNKTAIKSGISLTNLNLDPVAVQSAIVRRIINGRLSEIAKTLYSFAKEACPEFKQTDKFLVHLRSQLEGEKVLQQKVEKPYKDLSQEVSSKVELSKKPDTFLNGTSVVKGISRGIN
ncbi:ankyrin repeat domain-containing protein [Wolbachia endosymbiont of Tetranychus urticae]|uniref:ankyrin repeat domain-containing protein n=1 Tax=Wolbachia endosymbiont of Tetranychus urticae TaxID=169184 RepID=UPI00397E6858